MIADKNVLSVVPFLVSADWVHSHHVYFLGKRDCFDLATLLKTLLPEFLVPSVFAFLLDAPPFLRWELGTTWDFRREAGRFFDETFDFRVWLFRDVDNCRWAIALVKLYLSLIKIFGSWRKLNWLNNLAIITDGKLAKWSIELASFGSSTSLI